MEFITGEEKKCLEQKLADLKARRPELSRRIGEARQRGDLSENADYHAARNEQGLVEAEIRRLEQRLKRSKVADDLEVPQDMVFLGSVVKLRDMDDNSVDLYKLVGESSGQFDGEQIEVTTGSPMGESLMKARVGDTVRVELPKATKRFKVVDIL
jgi:transcription elongation factor GreA